jgi:hypothetical protein
VEAVILKVEATGEDGAAKYVNPEEVKESPLPLSGDPLKTPVALLASEHVVVFHPRLPIPVNGPSVNVLFGRVVSVKS